MKKDGLFLVASVLAIMSLLLSSCAPVAAPTPTPKPAAVPSKVETPVAKPAAVPAAPSATPIPAVDQPRYGGTFNIAHNGDPISYDPIQESSVQSLSLVVPCYSGIVQHDPLEPTKVIGDLAERWDMSPDGLSYTFHLFRNVKWHDGTPFTAEDARFTLDVVRKPPKGVLSSRQEWLRAVDKIEAVDKDTLKIALQYPSASFLHNLGDGRMVIVPKHVFEAKGSMKRDVVGTGPFKFKSFAAGVTWSMMRNADYFIRGRPYLDGITFYIILDVATRFSALRTHRVHTLPWGTQGLTPSQAEIIQKDLSDKVAVDDYPGILCHSFSMLHTKAPWSDIRVRRAVDLTLDRPKLIKVALEGVGDVGGFMPPGSWGLPEAELLRMPGYRQPKDADIAEARRLLAEAGYAQGFKTITIGRNLVQYERGIVGVKQQLAQIGIEVTVAVKDQSTVMDLFYRRDYDTAVAGQSFAYDDPDQVFGLQFVTGVPRNYSDFSDEKTDKWYDEQSRTLDPTKRKEIVLNMQRRMSELVPCSMLYWLKHQLGRWKEVKNFRAGIGNFNHLKFQDVWLAN